MTPADEATFIALWQQGLTDRRQPWTISGGEDLSRG
jgi:hypothetical protein